MGLISIASRVHCALQVDANNIIAGAVAGVETITHGIEEEVFKAWAAANAEARFLVDELVRVVDPDAEPAGGEAAPEAPALQAVEQKDSVAGSSAETKPAE